MLPGGRQYPSSLREPNHPLDGTDDEEREEAREKRRREGSLSAATSIESKFHSLRVFSATNLELSRLTAEIPGADDGTAATTTSRRRRRRKSGGDGRKDDSLGGSRKCAPEPSTIPR